jgi:hypothetical protein
VLQKIVTERDWVRERKRAKKRLNKCHKVAKQRLLARSKSDSQLIGGYQDMRIDQPELLSQSPLLCPSRLTHFPHQILAAVPLSIICCDVYRDEKVRETTDTTALTKDESEIYLFGWVRRMRNAVKLVTVETTGEED